MCLVCDECLINATILLFSLPLFFLLKWGLQQDKATKFFKLEILKIRMSKIFYRK